MKFLMPLSIVTWNVNSLRSAIGKGFVLWLQKMKPDIVCLQEIRATRDQLYPLESLFEGYQAIWNPAIRPGYAGTAILTRFKPVTVEYGLHGNTDEEGRALTVDFGNFRIASLYAPNAQPQTPKLKIKCSWLDQLRTHVQARSDKPFIVAGDLNVAHSKLDSRGLERPSGINGCTDEERRGLQQLIDTTGLCDPLRERSGESILSTWWHARESERHAHAGIRFDYILCPNTHREFILDSAIHSDVWGSDHCPTSLTMNILTQHLLLADAIAKQVSLL